MIKLSYFDFPGGRGEPARLALTIAGIDFEDDRIPLADWPQLRESKPLHAVPTVEIDARRIKSKVERVRSIVVDRLGAITRLATLLPSLNRA